MYLAVWLSSEGSNANHPQKTNSWSTVIRPLGDSEADIKQDGNIAEMSSRTHSTHCENWVFKLEFFFYLSGREWKMIYNICSVLGLGCLVVTVVNILSSKSQFMRNGRIPCLKDAIFLWLWLNSITISYIALLSIWIRIAVTLLTGSFNVLLSVAANLPIQTIHFSPFVI